MNLSASEFLIWQCSDHRYGLEIANCREVVKGVHITPLPGAPAFVTGLVNLRGAVVAILDLDVLLGYKKEADIPPHASIIRMRTDGYPLAFIADLIVDATVIPADQIETAPANLNESETAILRAIAKTADGLVLIPNIITITENFLTNKRSANA